MKATLATTLREMEWSIIESNTSERWGGVQLKATLATLLTDGVEYIYMGFSKPAVQTGI